MGGAFLAAAFLARVGRRIGLPTIPLFILAGILLGPHTPGFVLLHDPNDLEMLSALGLVLLLFYLGLEFHMDDLKSGGRKMAVAGTSYVLLNFGAGLGFGFLLGWGTSEALLLAGVLSFSSSAIVTKVLVDLGRIGRPETKPILGITVIEDIYLAVYLAVLQPVISGADSAASAMIQMGKAFGFLLLLAIAARWCLGFIGRLIGTKDNELLVISFVGAAVLVAGVSEKFGVVDAIGAFMVGLMLGNTTSGDRIRELVLPLRDAFGAIFFFAFGLSIAPSDMPTVMWPVIIAVLVTIVVNIISGLVAARLYRFGAYPAANVATTLVARGEFALILATMAALAGLDERLSPFIAGYVLIMAVLGPLAAGRSHWLARLLPGGRATPPDLYPADEQEEPAGGSGEPDPAQRAATS
ncbi:cation:proton antiporter [Streptomyces sp. TP-A0874]|uniref:cation:proton antiporter n=1 Tax=Streptomyces sp. TP-A0874 TaxID=549819 RepID=UPI000852E057|nr:cation:proton antiporter [Streptomyces sp. TP-A0874]